MCLSLRSHDGLNITARQYGEVVLPDASTGQGPGTPSTRGHKAVTVQGGYGTCFCCHGTNFIACWCDRGTRLIGAINLSPVTKLVAGTGVVSRYKLSRRQLFVMVQDFNYLQMRVSGCKLQQDLSREQEQKQKP